MYFLSLGRAHLYYFEKYFHEDISSEKNDFL